MRGAFYFEKRQCAGHIWVGQEGSLLAATAGKTIVQRCLHGLPKDCETWTALSGSGRINMKQRIRYGRYPGEEALLPSAVL